MAEGSTEPASPRIPVAKARGRGAQEMAHNKPYESLGRPEGSRTPVARPTSCYCVRGLQLPAAPGCRACALAARRTQWRRQQWLKFLICRSAAVRASGLVLSARDNVRGTHPGRSPFRYGLGRVIARKFIHLNGKLRPSLPVNSQGSKPRGRGVVWSADILNIHKTQKVGASQVPSADEWKSGKMLVHAEISAFERQRGWRGRS